MELRVFRFVDFAHPTAAEGLDDAIVIQCGPYHVSPSGDVHDALPVRSDPDYILQSVFL
jgi:hypothetical protein